MKIFVYFLVVFSSFLEAKTICLNMIVKNEAEVIEGCLASVKDLVDYWVIVDTGSTDGTQDVIRQFMKDVPGELHERPWVNFSHNRNEALEIAKTKADYTMFIDADERWVRSPRFKMPALDKDFYRIVVRELGVVDSVRKCLIDNRLDWKYEGVLHEVVVCPEARTFEELKEVMNVNNTVKGARTKDPDKYKKDAAVLEQGLLEEPNNSRYMFYLGQCYGNAGEFERSIEAFEKRALMGGGEPELFWSLYCIGKLQESLQLKDETIIESYWRAHRAFPHRVEPLYRIARIYLAQNSPFLAYLISKEALRIPPTQENAMVERWIYDWGMKFLFASCAYYVGSKDECRIAVMELLMNPSIPDDIRKILNNNLNLL